MQIDLSAKNARNLSVLKKIDDNVSEIISEASDTAIYKFDAANKKWDRFGVQGAVFVTQNVSAPFHSLIVLNKLGPDDFLLDLSVVRNAKIQDLFIMIKYATSGAPLIIGLWLRDNGEREALLEAILRLSGETDGGATKRATSGPKSSLIQQSTSTPVKAKVPDTLVSTGATTTTTVNTTVNTNGALLMRILSGNQTGNQNANTDSPSRVVTDFLTDKEISAKSTAASSKNNVHTFNNTTTSTSSEDKKASEISIVTSPSSSSSLLKSILNVQVAQVAPPVTPIARRLSRDAPPPLSALQKNGHNSSPLDGASREKEKTENNEVVGKAQQENKFSANVTESSPGSVQKIIPLGNSGNTGGGLIPSSVRIHFIGKKNEIPEKVRGPECLENSEKKIYLSSPVSSMTSVPNPTSVPSKTENNTSFFTPSSSSLSASASLLEALSIVPKCSSPFPVAKQNVSVQGPVSIPVSVPVPVPVVDVAVPRRMSVSQLFQTQPTAATTARTPTGNQVQNKSIQQVQQVQSSGGGGMATIETNTNTNNRLINRIPIEQVFQSSSVVSEVAISMSQSKENMTKSESLFTMLKLRPNETEQSDPVKFADSKQSKAIPGVESFFVPPSVSSLSASVSAGTETAGSKPFRNTATTEYTSSVKSSATPPALGSKTDRVDSNHTNSNTNSNTQHSALPLSTRSSPASFFASSSSSVTPKPPLSTSPPTFPQRVPSSLTAPLTASASQAPHTDTLPAHRLPLGLTSRVSLNTTGDRSRSTPSPPSLIKSAPSQHEHITPSSRVSLHGSLGQYGKNELSHITPQKIPDQVQVPLPTPLKFLSPSDLTGYIRKF